MRGIDGLRAGATPGGGWCGKPSGVGTRLPTECPIARRHKGPQKPTQREKISAVL
jgi:hypothetical protein